MLFKYVNGVVVLNKMIKPSLDVGCDCKAFGEINLDRHRGVPLDVLADLNYPLPFKNKAFRKVFCYHVLEHLNRPEKVIDELIRVSRVVEIKVPYKTGSLAKSDRNHKHFFNSKWFKDYAENRGLHYGGYVSFDFSRFSIKHFLPLEINVWIWA